MIIVDLSYSWKYWVEHILPIIQEQGAYKSHIRRLGEYVFEFRCRKAARQLENAVQKKVQELLDIQDGYGYVPNRNSYHKPLKKAPTLAKEWNDGIATFGPGGIHCACCAPPSAERKADFVSKFRMRNKEIILNEIKDLAYGE